MSGQISKIEFYCEHCEYTSYIKGITVTTEGFGIKCPHCRKIFWFSAEWIERVNEISVVSTDD